MEIIDISNKLLKHPTKKNKIRKLSDIKQIVLHTTDDVCKIESLAKYDIGPNHISKTGCPSITYHYIILEDGKIYKTLDEKEISWHCGMHNDASIGVAIMYKCTNKNGEDEFAPSQVAIDATVRLLQSLLTRFGLKEDKVLGHRELRGYFRLLNGSKIFLKTCPGMKINLEELRKQLTV